MDITEQIDSVARSVGARAVDAVTAHTVVLSRVYDTGLDDLWDACTNAERIPRWFMPVSGELKLGGRYQLEGNAGGTIETCDAPHGFTATWEFAGVTSWIELRLSPVENGTRFELTHIAQDDDHWKQFGPGAVGAGWDGALMGLGNHLDGGVGISPAEAVEWMASAEGKEFFTQSSERWCAAYIASGADETVARESAQRTTAAFTGG